MGLCRQRTSLGNSEQTCGLSENRAKVPSLIARYTQKPQYTLHLSCGIVTFCQRALDVRNLCLPTIVAGDSTAN